MVIPNDITTKKYLYLIYDNLQNNNQLKNILIKKINLPNNIKTCSFSFCKDERGYDVDYCFYTANNINIKKKWLKDKINYLKQFGNNLEVEYYYNNNLSWKIWIRNFLFYRKC